MFKSIGFVLRIAIAWGLVVLVVASLYSSIPLLGRFELPIVLVSMATMALVVGGAFSHLRRVRLIAGHIDGDALGNRQKRLVEIPLEAGEAFDLLDAAIRELPGAEQIQSARDSVTLPSDRQIIHTVVRDFAVDGQQGVSRPLGMSGRRLDVEVHVVTGMASIITNLERCVEEAGVSVLSQVKTLSPWFSNGWTVASVSSIFKITQEANVDLAISC